MNPCPCGNLGNPSESCRCTPDQIQRYVGKISGPLLDRIAIHVFVRPVEVSALTAGRRGETSRWVLEHVMKARSLQAARFGEEFPVSLNARMGEKLLRRSCRLDETGEALLQGAQKKLRISARGRAHVLRLARTIADLEGVDEVRAPHVAEAVQYRMRELPT